MVEGAALDMMQQHVEVYVRHPAGQHFTCPKCARELSAYDRLAERAWRYPDRCQFLTYLYARPPSRSYPDHGVYQEMLPRGQAGSRFTNLLEVLAIDVLLAVSIKKAAETLKITWDEAWHLMERAVLRGRVANWAGLPWQIGIDEKAIAKDHRYMALVCDLEEVSVEYIGEDRKETNLTTYFDAFHQVNREKIKVTNLDMWPTYINACRNKVPGADSKMIFDRFHIMRNVLDAVDKVRKRKTDRTWAIKEALCGLWDYMPLTWAVRLWKRWYSWVTHNRLTPMIAVAKLITCHLLNVLTYFAHRITNAVAEVLNFKIATVQKRACGFRSSNHFKSAVYFHCGGLNLYPATVTHTKAG